jgi:Fe-S-cluster formation regulator IscX/YfhJ
VEPQVLAVLKEIERRELALDLDEFSDDDDLDEESVLENG